MSSSFRARPAPLPSARALAAASLASLTLSGAACVAPRASPSPVGAGVEPALAGKRVEARGGVVVTSAADASNAGLAMLRQGGNAIDAAVAASFALGVVDPSQTGLGGYGVGVAWFAKERRAEVMEAMGQAGADSAWGLPDPARPGAAPAAAAGTTPAAAPRPISFDGGDAREPRTALVPGFVAGLLEWQAARGKLPRAAVLAPAIALARDGFVVGPLNHRLFAASADKLKADPEAAALFMPGGEVLRVGDRLVQPRLATLLEAIAQGGARAFYEGDFPRRVAEKTRRVGGLLDAADFAAYRPSMRRPVCSAFGPYTVLGAPSPVAGASLAELLNLAERTGLTRGGDPTRDPQSAVRMADALRVSVADRRLAGGHPEWAPGPVRGLASPEFAADARGAGGHGGARLDRARRRVGARGRGGAGAVRVARSVSGDAAPGRCAAGGRGRAGRGAPGHRERGEPDVAPGGDRRRAERGVADVERGGAVRLGRLRRGGVAQLEREPVRARGAGAASEAGERADADAAGRWVGRAGGLRGGRSGVHPDGGRAGRAARGGLGAGALRGAPGAAAAGLGRRAGAGDRAGVRAAGVCGAAGAWIRGDQQSGEPAVRGRAPVLGAAGRGGGGGGGSAKGRRGRGSVRS
jgi:hypothetical protein